MSSRCVRSRSAHRNAACSVCEDSALTSIQQETHLMLTVSSFMTLDQASVSLQTRRTGAVGSQLLFEGNEGTSF